MPVTQTTIEPASAFAAKFTEAQDHGAKSFARACDVFSRTAQEIWSSQPELFKLETGQVLKSFAPPKAGENPAAAFAAQCQQLHENADQVIARMRQINDLAWNCGWEIASIYAEGLQGLWKPVAVPAMEPASKKAAA